MPTLDRRCYLSGAVLTLYIQQKVRRGKIEQRLKTANAVREVDLHPAIATLLKRFVGRRKHGLLFCTRTGKPLSPTHIIRRHLHMALKERRSQGAILSLPQLYRICTELPEHTVLYRFPPFTCFIPFVPPIRCFVHVASNSGETTDPSVFGKGKFRRLVAKTGWLELTW